MRNVRMSPFYQRAACWFNGGAVIAAIEMNPVLVGRQGDGLVIVDAVIERAPGILP